MTNIPNDLATVPPFSWVISLSEHFPWFYVMALFLLPATLVTLWQGLVYFRARQVHYDRAYGERKLDLFVYFKDGSQRGRQIDQDKAYERRITWPKLVFPLYLVAVGMFVVQLLWMHPDTYIILAALWFLFTSVRKIMGIHAARKVFVLKHGKGSLPNTFWQDVNRYYECIWGRPEDVEREPWKRLFDKGVIGTPLDKVCQGFAFVFGKGSPLWSLLRIWDWPMYFIDLIILAAWAMIWPVAAVVTPSYYLEVVKDFERWTRPWVQWHKNRRRSYDPTIKVVKGDVVKDKDEDEQAGTGNPAGAQVSRRSTY